MCCTYQWMSFSGQALCGRPDSSVTWCASLSILCIQEVEWGVFSLDFVVLCTLLYGFGLVSAESPYDSHLILEQIALYPIKSCGPCKVRMCACVWCTVVCNDTYEAWHLYVCTLQCCVCAWHLCVCVCTGGEVLTKLTFVSYLTNQNEVMSFTTSFSNKRGRWNLYWLSKDVYMQVTVSAYAHQYVAMERVRRMTLVQSVEEVSSRVWSEAECFLSLFAKWIARGGGWHLWWLL